MARLPNFLKQYFWDVDFAKIDSHKNTAYIIERILEVGNIQSIRWLVKTFDKTLIKSVVRRSRALSPITANYWSHLLGMGQKDIACLQKPYLAVRQTHWPY